MNFLVILFVCFGYFHTIIQNHYTDNYKNQLKEGIKKLNEYLHPVENIYKDMCKKYFNESIYNNAKKFLNNLDFELNDKKLNYAFREIFIKQDIQFF